MTGTSVRMASDGTLRPSRVCSAMNGRTTPSRQARISPSRMPSQPSDSAALHDLRVPAADVVEVARVEPDLVPLLVQLRADPVVLVLDPDLGSQPGNDLGGILRGRREHELERMEERQGGAGKRVVTGQHRQPAGVADEHARPLDLVERPIERLGDGGVDKPLAQPDPEIAADHLDHVLRGQRVASLPAASAGSPTCAPSPKRPRWR